MRGALDILALERVIAPSLAPGLPLLDLSVRSEQEQAAELYRYAVTQTQTPHLRVFRLGDEDHVALLADLGSFDTFWSELAPELPAPIDYAEFAAARALAYWTRQLADAPQRLELPTDRARAAVRTQRDAQASFACSASTAARLRALAHADASTLFDALLAAFAVLLHRYSGQDDIVIGLPFVHRKTVVLLRGDVSGNPTFRNWLSRSRAAVNGARDHELAFDKLVTTTERGAAPLFQVGFELVDAAVASPSAVTSGLDIALAMTLRGDELAGTFAYNAELFDAATIERMIGHFAMLLDSIAKDPDQRIGELQLLTERERQQIVVAWNDTARPYAHDRCTHELFEAQVARTPDATALVFETQRLTYRELDRRANQLARHLRERGVGPDVLVGVCLERRPELAIALLAVWKAGGAYVPLDPTLPSERLTFMMSDARARLLVTDRAQRARFPDTQDVVCVDSDAVVITSWSIQPLHAAVEPHHLAYVMYTSGSTGRPKGVMIHHRGLVNYLEWTLSAYAPASGDAVPVHSSIAFDLTVTSIFPPLLAGGKIEMLREDVGGQNLVAAVKRSGGSSLVKITPAHLQLLSEQLGPDGVGGRTRLLVIGGEQLLAENLAVWRDHAPATRLINEYGPTETVVGCCVHEVRPTIRAAGR